MRATRAAEAERLAKLDAEEQKANALRAAEREAEERKQAEAAREAEAKQKTLAQAKEAEANAVVKFIENKVFSAARPMGQEGGLGQDVTLRAAIAASLPALDTSFTDQPLVEARLRTTLGITFLYLGDANAAMAQNERARVIYTERRGPDHPNTLVSMNNLANSYAALGRHAEAVTLREQTLAAMKRVLPPDHPDTLGSMNNLANSYAALGRHAEAVTLREQTLAAMKRVLPPDHPDTLASMNNLAISYAALGRHAEAVTLYEQTLAARKRVLPPDHPDTLGSQTNLAFSYRSLGREADALPLLEDSFRRMLAALPANHPFLRVAAFHLSSCYLALGRGADATATADRYLRHVVGMEGVPSDWIAEMLYLRNRHPAAMGDAAGCRATAEVCEKHDSRDAGSLYDAACFRAVASAVQAKAGGADAARLAADDADRAMLWLTKAVAAGYKNRAHMETDADLSALRGRKDFQALLASLPTAREAAPPPRPVK